MYDHSSDTKKKMAVLGKAKDLKCTNIYVNEDYAEALRQKHRELISAMKAARERGDIAYIRYDKLIVHPPSQKLKDRKGTVRKII